MQIYNEGITEEIQQEIIEMKIENEFETIECSEITFINNNQFIGIKVNDNYKSNTICNKSCLKRNKFIFTKKQ